MIIIRDDKKIARFRTIGKVASFAGMGALLGGMVLVFIGDPQQVFWLQMAALLVGWVLSQVGIYYANRYLRRPRPDEVLDEALEKVKDGRLYHYILPVPHVLLTPDGIILLIAKFQGGRISVQNDRWKQSGMGLRRFFGQENLGNPTREAEQSVGVIANFLKKEAPTVEEVPIAPLIVFTSKGMKELDLKGSTIPAMHYTKVKGFLKQQKRARLPQTDYEAIRAAFDSKAGFVVGDLSLLPGGDKSPTTNG
jgi:hypothetical protein